MSLTEIKDNINKLEELDKNVLIDYVNELMINTKKQESKNLSLKTEIKYLKRNLTKVKQMIDRVVENQDEKKSFYGDKK